MKQFEFLSNDYLGDNTVQMQKLSIETYRLLSEGTPVTIAAIAKKLGISDKESEALVSKFPPSVIQYDDNGAIVAFIGLSLIPTAHQFLLDDNTMYTWCVLDGLFLPELLGKPANIITYCPVTDKKISVQLSPDQLTSYEPKEVVMSFVTVDIKSCKDNLRSAFCNYVNFFQNSDAFKHWAEDKESASMITLKDAHVMAGQRNKIRYKDINLKN